MCVCVCHVAEEITDLNSTLSNYAEKIHKHKLSDLSDYPGLLDNIPTEENPPKYLGQNSGDELCMYSIENEIVKLTPQNIQEHTHARRCVCVRTMYNYALIKEVGG